MLKTAKTYEYVPPEDGRWSWKDAFSQMTLTPTRARQWALYLLTTNKGWVKMSYKAVGGRKVYTVTREELQ